MWSKSSQPSRANPKSRSDYMSILSKNDRHAEFRRNLKLLIENLLLTNVRAYINQQEIINKEDYRVYKENDVLKDLISTLKISEKSIQGYELN